MGGGIDAQAVTVSGFRVGCRDCKCGAVAGGGIAAAEAATSSTSAGENVTRPTGSLLAISVDAAAVDDTRQAGSQATEGVLSAANIAITPVRTATGSAAATASPLASAARGSTKWSSQPMVVTAASENHLCTLLQLLQNLNSTHPGALVLPTHFKHS
jgi:hypothetical protein